MGQIPPGARDGYRVALEKAGERALHIMHGSQVDDLKTARLQTFQRKVATVAAVPPEKLLADIRRCPISQSPRLFSRYKHGKETTFLQKSGDGQDPQKALFLCRCQSQQLQRSSCEISHVIVVACVIHDLAPASRMAFSALQRAVNVLHAKTLRKWIVRILMMLLMMISDTNDTENNNCYVNLNFL